MTDWSKPTVASNYTNYTAELVARDVSVALWFDSQLVNDSAIVAGTKRWNSANNNWEKYLSGTWQILTTLYNISISGTAGSVPFSGISNRPTTLSGYGIADSYSASQVNTLLNTKANLAGPVLTGSPKAPTPTNSSNDTSIATTSFVKNQGYLTTDEAQVGPTTILNCISSRYFYNSFLMTDGTIKECGYGANGQLADGGALSSLSNYTDAAFSENIEGETISKLFTSYMYRFALTASGKVYAAGQPGTSGVLGLGDSLVRTAFTLVDYFVSNNITIVDISAGGSIWGGQNYSKALFLASNGDVYVTGLISKGDGSAAIVYNIPTKVVGLSNITNIYSGGDSAYSPSFAWKNSTCYSFGTSYTGNSGQNIGTNVNNRPVQAITEFFSTVVKIVSDSGPSAGTTYALLSNGEVWACGYNAYGQIGDNTTTQSNVFKKVNSISNIVDITASGGIYGTAMARNNAGQIYAWGYTAQLMVTGVSANLLLPTLIPGTWKYMYGTPSCEGTVRSYFLISNTNEAYFTGYNATYCSGIASLAAQTFSGTPTRCAMPKLLTGEYPIEIMRDRKSVV